jgi:polyhydroxyalkanoate synthesis regulator phasin
MKKRKVIVALAITLAVGMGATAYAQSSGEAPVRVQRLGLGRITAVRGYDYITNILKEKLNLSDAEISTALNSGKTLYDIAAEKGMAQEEVKTVLLEERSNAINEAVKKGTISKEEGENLKKNLSSNLENCQGSFAQRRGLGQVKGMGRGQRAGQERGMMGTGQGRGYTAAPDSEK